MKMEESTDIIAEILYRSGVKHVVASSGSRSLRMVRAAADNTGFSMHMVVDERVAAFSALGISDCVSQPVALVCTSGSAMLNYAPAIAEAYYRGIPLIAITADRPIDVIDINDGQTIHQYHALDNIVKASVDIDATTPCTKEGFDIINRTISLSLSPRKGPVHINLHLEEGNDALTYKSIPYDGLPVAPAGLSMPDDTLSSHIKEIAYNKILVFLGQMPPDSNMDMIVEQLLACPNVVVIADIVSNCRAAGVITDIESIIGKIREESDRYRPQTVITLGKTSPVSRNLKEWLRSIDGYNHWRINDRQEPEDTYHHLERTIVADAPTFLKSLVDNMPKRDVPSYREIWLDLYDKAQAVKTSLMTSAQWSDITAVGMILEHLPENYNIQCSNGMSIRYMSLTGVKGHTLYCNRGVNGIDGSTSTALGFSSVAETPTLLVTGDMSAIYDISALFSGQLTPKFKMVILANDGGEIFRLTKATRDYERREQLLCNIPTIKWEDVAKSVDMDYFEASNKEELSKIIPSFFSMTGRASMLVVRTSPGNSETYRNIIKEIYNKI